MSRVAPLMRRWSGTNTQKVFAYWFTGTFYFFSPTCTLLALSLSKLNSNTNPPLTHTLSPHSLDSAGRIITSGERDIWRDFKSGRISATPLSWRKKKQKKQWWSISRPLVSPWLPLRCIYTFSSITSGNDERLPGICHYQNEGRHKHPLTQSQRRSPAGRGDELKLTNSFW